MGERTYHHGDLRRALLDAAVDAITESGPGGLSLRDLARRVGVSHAGPTHHFRDKPGLLTALATEGYDLLADALTATRARTGSHIELGVAYVEFAGRHRAHFEVMFRSDLYRADDPALKLSRRRAGQALHDSAADFPDGTRRQSHPEQPEARGMGESGGTASPAAREAVLAAWSLAHGFATLWLSGALPLDPAADPTNAARRILRQLAEDA